MANSIRNPIEWGSDQVASAVDHIGSVGRSVSGADIAGDNQTLETRQLSPGDLREALAKGVGDFIACRSDVAALCLVYPLAGLMLAWVSFDYNLLPLAFPLIAGFALLGPAAAIFLYEMSRRREAGGSPTWADAFSTFKSPSFGAMVMLGLGLVVVFLTWLVAAQIVYLLTLGPEPPASLGAFARDVLTTGTGWLMIVVGIAVGFVFAVAVLAVSVVSFPLLLDRNVGLGRAIATSLQVTRANPRVIALWGLVVVAGLALGTATLFLGLVAIMPVLGHATWHLYRKAVA